MSANNAILLCKMCNMRSGKCNYCLNRKRCDEIDCTLCFNNSFASHEKSKYWSPSNILTARQAHKLSKNKFNFLCDLCYHEFDKSLTQIDRGQWC